jgi:hypothetical protein
MKREIVRDSMIIVYNNSGSEIVTNRVVYASGNVGDVPTVALAKANSLLTMPAIGVTIEAIANNSYGRVMQVGLLENLDTSSLSVGDVLYVHDTIAGLVRTTPPVTPSLIQEIGTVLVDDASVGAIQIISRSMRGNEYGTIQNTFSIGDGAAGSKTLTFNAASDASLVWDETNLNIGGPVTIGDGGTTDYTQVEADCTLEFNGAATVWDDMRITPGDFDRPGGSDPAYYAYDVNGSGTTIELTEWAKNDYGTFTIQIPHKYKEGSNISVHAHWTPGANGAGESGNTVGWKCIYSWANIDGTFPNPTTADLSDACDGTNHKHQMTPAVSITGTSKTISSMLICKFTRTDTGADDTWAGSGAGNLPLLLEVDFHFEIDTVGSRTIAAK